MILDARTLPDGHVLSVETCIVGAGAAGISLACELAKSGGPILLVESGGFEFDLETHRLNRGSIAGLPYDLEGTRFRMVGGSTNAWGGQIRPLGAHVFERRPGVVEDSWPFARAELDPHYARAYAFLGVDPASETLPRLRGGNPCALAGRIRPPVEIRTALLSRRTVFKERLEALLKSGADVRLLVHATVNGITLDRDSDAVASVTAVSLGGAAVKVLARRFVLAMGGIENARLLLQPDESRPEGLGNRHDLVGRYFMEHPHISSGAFEPSDAATFGHALNPSFRFARRRSVAAIAVAPVEQQRQRLLDYHAFIMPLYRGQDSEAYEALATMARNSRAVSRLYRGNVRLADILKNAPQVLLGALGAKLHLRLLQQMLHLVNVVEPVPDRDSRVRLGLSRDRLGMLQASLDWRCGAAECETMRRSQGILKAGLAEMGLGRLRIDRTIEETTVPPLRWGWHHMGTTRMAHSSRAGVVDADCRLHGVPNLYVAGSSVFPTAGDNFPTLTIVALAIRLADHLAERDQARTPLSASTAG